MFKNILGILVLLSFAYCQYDSFIREMDRGSLKKYKTIEEEIISYNVLTPPSKKRIRKFRESETNLIYKKIIDAYWYQQLNNYKKSYALWKEIQILSDDKNIDNLVNLNIAFFLFFLENNFEDSMVILNKLIAENNDYNNAYYLRAIILFSYKKYKEGIEDFNLLLNRKYPIDYMFLYKDYEKIGDKENSFKYLPLVIEQHPKNIKLREKLANWLWEKKDYEGAIKHYNYIVDKMVDKKQTATAYFALARYHKMKKNIKLSKKYVDEAIKLNRGKYKYFYFRSSIQDENKDATKIISDLTKSINLMDEYKIEENDIRVDIYKRLVNLSLKKKIYSKALTNSIKLYSKETTDDNLYLRAISYANNKMYGNAIEDYSQLIKKKSLVTLLEQRGNIYYQNGQKWKALKDFLKVYKKDSKNINIIKSIVVVYLSPLKVRQSIKYIKKGLEIEPNNSRFHFLLGLLELYKKKIDVKKYKLNKNIKIANTLGFNIEKWLNSKEGKYFKSLSKFKILLHKMRNNY